MCSEMLNLSVTLMCTASLLSCEPFVFVQWGGRLFCTACAVCPLMPLLSSATGKRRVRACLLIVVMGIHWGREKGAFLRTEMYSHLVNVKWSVRPPNSSTHQPPLIYTSMYYSVCGPMYACIVLHSMLPEKAGIRLFGCSWCTVYVSPCTFYAPCAV